MIEKAPLQVYTSALIFSPKMSIVRKWYWNQRPNWIKMFPSVEGNWSDSLQTLEGHSDKSQQSSSQPMANFSPLHHTTTLFESGTQIRALYREHFKFSIGLLLLPSHTITGVLSLHRMMESSKSRTFQQARYKARVNVLRS
jgi:hypothetical protein